MRSQLSLLILVLISASSHAEDPRRARSIARYLSELAAAGGSSLIVKDLNAANIAGTAADMEFMHRWLSRNSESINGVQPSPFATSQRFGTATQKGNKLYLHVRNLEENQTFRIPRLHNSVLRISILGESPSSGIMSNLNPEVDGWAIKLPRESRAENLPVVVLELDSPPRVAGGEIPVVRQLDETIVLHSRDGVPHGKMLRFEPQPHKNTIGYWIDESDWVEWRFQPSASQDFEVVLRYGCGENQGGSEIMLSFSDPESNERTEIPFTIEATGGFQNWRNVNVGTIKLTAGREFELTVKPLRKAHAAIMDIQQITLTPK
jgi:hypothetical protein